VLGGEAAKTNVIVFGFTRLVLEPTIYRNRGDHANYEVDWILDTQKKISTNRFKGRMKRYLDENMECRTVRKALFFYFDLYLCA
jgi:hypothetical protein